MGEFGAVKIAWAAILTRARLLDRRSAPIPAVSRIAGDDVSAEENFGSPASDSALMRLLHEGREDALVELFGRYSKLVYSTALRVLRDRAEAEDATQMVFMRIWRKPPRLSEESGSLAAWFAVVARNQSVNFVRQRVITVALEDCNLWSPCGLLRKLEFGDRIGLLLEAMRQLSEPCRTLLELAYFDGLTHEEIAIKTGQPLGTVKSRIRRSLRALGILCRETKLGIPGEVA